MERHFYKTQSYGAFYIDNRASTVDYSHMSQDFIFSKTQELEEEIPDETILQDIAKVKIEDLRNEVYANDTILCLKINDYFEIYEWRKQEFVRVDKK